VKLPEPLFAIINPVMRTFLRSPIHGLWSSSIMLITFTGRHSGKQFTTPVRYIESDGVVRCFTAKENQWWRNLRNEAPVKLRVKGQSAWYRAKAIHDDPVAIRKWLTIYLAQYPQDADYHDIRLTKDKRLVEEDLERAVAQAVVVEAHLTGPA